VQKCAPFFLPLNIKQLKLKRMHPITFRKKMIEAYMAGAEAMESGDIDVPSKKEAKDWFDNEYGIQESEKCECCEDEFHS
jgi:hypothetical protein